MIETNMAGTPPAGDATRKRTTLLRRIAGVLLVCAALTLTLFPFDWLARVWPAYAVAFDRVFASAASHHIGHTVIFLIVGLAILFVVPRLVAHPWVYATLAVGGALTQEAIQAFAKRDWPNWGDARDIGFDLLGLALAFLLVWLWRRLARSTTTP